MSKAHREYFNRLAPEWNTTVSDEPMLGDYLHRFGILRGDRVLDIGAGTGRMTKHLARLVGDDGCVVAEDSACAMLREGKRVIGNEQPNWLCDDASALALKDSVFDKVICFSTFPHFLDPLAVLKEMYRVLRPGGKLLILHTCSSQQLNEFHASLEGVVSNDRLPSIQEMIQLLNKTGFVSEETIENDDLYWVKAGKAG